MGEILVAMFVVEDKSLFQASLSIGLPIQVYVRHLGWEAVYIKALTLTSHAAKILHSSFKMSGVNVI